MSQRDVAHALVEAALSAIDPRSRTRDRVAAWVADGRLRPGAWLLAFGKASVAMARGALDAVEVAGGLVYAPAHAALPGLEVVVGHHPFPADDAEVQGRRALALASRLGEGDQILCLVSGGGSSLFEVPRVPIGSLRAATKRLMARGGDIHELNAFRVGMSEVKGGRLARALAPAEIFTAIVHDVPGGPLHEVASGPTLPYSLSEPPRFDDDSLADAWQAPPAMVPPSTTAVVADNRTAIDALVDAFHGPSVVLPSLSGEASAVGPVFLDDALRCLGEGAQLVVAGGETTVTVRGSGHGGRNQELVLGALEDFRDRAPAGALLCAFGTDGVDGRSEHAGAILDAGVIAAAEGRDIGEVLARNDSATFFAETGGALVTGPTGTNVADVVFFLAGPG